MNHLHASSRWPALPASSFAAAATLLAAALLTACGGGGSPAAESPKVQTQAKAPSTAPAIPVAPHPAFAASGPGSYRDTLQNYNRVGEVLHARQ